MSNIKWLAIGILFILGGVGQYIYSELPNSQIALGWVVLVLVSAVIAGTTPQGQVFIDFVRDANIELRKVVWPSKQETLQTSLVVLGVVLLMGFILWLMDSALLHVVGVITGQKG
ncbi:MAG: preprotein translocase subunit SecE [Legionellales bacterium]|nr:preprotein translocase subunit SecE [Legionellales bacterium]